MTKNRKNSLILTNFSLFVFSQFGMSLKPGEPDLWKRVLRLIDCVDDKEKAYWSHASGSEEDILVPGLPEGRDPETLSAPERRMLFYVWIEHKVQDLDDEDLRCDLEDCIDLFRTRTL